MLTDAPCERVRVITASVIPDTVSVKTLVAGLALALVPVPAAADEPAALIDQINALCVASRDAILRGGSATIRLRDGGRAIQEQRYDATKRRLADSGWPAVTVAGVGTYDRSGFVLDGRLRKHQVTQAARYLGFQQRPWVRSRKQYGVISDTTFEAFLRSDLLAPDRYIDLDSTLVPAQPARCAAHVLEDKQATVSSTSNGASTTYVLDYRLPDEGIRVHSSLVAQDGRFVSGSLRMSGRSRLHNVIAWSYGPQQVALPRRVVPQRQWIKATDAAALEMDLRYLAGSIPGKTVTKVRKAARKALPTANRGHVVRFRARDTAAGIVLYGRNPYTDAVVAFEVRPGQPARRLFT